MSVEQLKLIFDDFVILTKEQREFLSIVVQVMSHERLTEIMTAEETGKFTLADLADLLAQWADEARLEEEEESVG